jgi:hypothetical protein
MVREQTSDELCGGCATEYMKNNPGDGILTVAFQIAGEVGNAEAVTCTDCGGVIYNGTEADDDGGGDDIYNRSMADDSPYDVDWKRDRG